MPRAQGVRLGHAATVPTAQECSAEDDYWTPEAATAVSVRCAALPAHAAQRLMVAAADAAVLRRLVAGERVDVPPYRAEEEEVVWISDGGSDDHSGGGGAAAAGRGAGGVADRSHEPPLDGARRQSRKRSRSPEAAAASGNAAAPGGAAAPANAPASNASASGALEPAAKRAALSQGAAAGDAALNPATPSAAAVRAMTKRARKAEVQRRLDEQFAAAKKLGHSDDVARAWNNGWWATAISVAAMEAGDDKLARQKAAASLKQRRADAQEAASRHGITDPIGAVFLQPYTAAGGAAATPAPAAEAAT
ncbi:hypothetical protein FNF31_07528 [Cafeteria roenbergensis]|uniref:Uncharacterized protein n=1 Tax=Cafeteria roenbergensis TaxID=33653 RepID=A0A5A8C407_CAFRO|nr:hypothetical protein FNF31_07528 [Cafeteria roenbergensis]